MKKIVVASTNSAKLKAVELGFRRIFNEEAFTVSGVPVASGVRDQPLSNDETYQGALNRLQNVRAAESEADYWVALEGGSESTAAGTEAYAWVVIHGSDGQMGRGKTGVYFLPPKMVELLDAGKELAEATDAVFGTRDSKQTSGAVGLLTGGVMSRAEYYADAVVFALIPFKNPDLYPIDK